MPTIKIALIQKKAIPNHKARNLKLAIQYITEASRMGADIVLFPEMWSNGYAPPFDGAFDNPTDPAFEKERKEWLGSAVTLESDYVAAIKDAAATYKIGVCATFLSKRDDRIQNTAVIIDRSGNILLNYAKVHTCDFYNKSSTDFLIIFSYLRKCWKGLLYQTFPAFCVSEDTPHIMAFRSLIWHWKVVKP